ncbi:MAG: TonB-dependent receptor [Dehalococcoidia bacterium]
MRTDISIAVGAAVLSLSTAAMAQQPMQPPTGTPEARAGAIEEIVVTSRRREENIQDVPISIVAFTGTDASDNRMESMRTLGEMVPNLEVRSVFQNSMPAIYMRGVGTNDFNPAAASAIGLYVDGVYRSLLAGALFQTFDLDRVEVLRGPQGTLYGKNTTGGSINYWSKMPGEEFDGYLKGGVGNYDSYEVEGAVTIPMAETLSSRVSFLRRKSDGYVKNRGSGAKSFLGEDNWAARALISFKPSDDLRVLLKVHGGELDTNFTFPSRGLFDPASVDGRSFTALPCQQNVLQFQCADFSGYVAPGLYEVDQNGPGFEKVDLWGSSLTVDWDAGESVTLTSISDYEKVRRNTFNDSEAGPFVLADGLGNDSSYQVTQELRATGKSGPLAWVVGAYGFKSVVNTSFDIQFPADGSLGGDFGFWTFSDSEDRIQTDNYAFFGEGTFSVTDRFRVTAGLRYNWEKKKSRQSEYRYIQYSGTPDVGTPQGTPCGPAPSQADPNNCLPGRRESKSWSDWSGNLTLDYDIADDVMVFASYKRGFKSGGFSAALTTCEFTCFGSFAPGPPWDGTRGDGTSLDTTYDPETLDAYEFGLKSMWFDRRLQLNMNAFYYAYHDMQVFTLIASGAQFIQVTENASSAKIKGGELELQARPATGLELRAGLALLDAKYKNYTTAPQGDLSGNRLVNAPKWSGNVSAAYEFPVGAGKLRTFLAANYTDKIYYSADNIDRLMEDSVWVLNGNINYVFPNEQLEISVWARNLTDERYISQAFDGSGLGYDQLIPSQPRTYGVNFTYSFGGK